MNRDKEISNAALKYTNDYGYFNCNLDDVECGFEDGAKWADEHPANSWHSVKDGDLPKESKGDLFNLTLLVRMSNGRVFPAYYDIKDNIFADEFNEDIKIAYWMEIPELPTELEKEEL